MIQGAKRIVWLKTVVSFFFHTGEPGVVKWLESIEDPGPFHLVTLPSLVCYPPCVTKERRPIITSTLDLQEKTMRKKESTPLL